jgi:hypothetical protein
MMFRCRVCDLSRPMSRVFNDGVKPMSVGEFAIVRDMGDGTVIKFFRYNSNNPALTQILMKNEIHCLSTFHGRVGDFKSPVLVDDPVYYDADVAQKSGISGAIRMTRLPGAPAKWKQLIEMGSATDVQIHGAQLGGLIAALHAQGNQNSWDMPAAVRSSGMGIYFLGIEDREFQHLLQQCNVWYLRRQKFGFAHADMADRNIMVDDRGRITGVLDFSISGNHRNPLIDFDEMPLPIFLPAVHQYGEALGRRIDPLMFTMTKLSCDVSRLERAWNDPDATDVKNNLIRSVVEQVYDISFKLGFIGSNHVPNPIKAMVAQDRYPAMI